MKFSAFVLLLLYGFLGSSQSFEDLYKVAADSNRGVRAAYESFNASMQVAAQVRGLPDPILTFGDFIIPIETRLGPQNAKLGLSQMFPWFGTQAALENTATSMAQAKFSEFLDKKNYLYFELAQSYYPLAEKEQLLELQKENLQILKSYKALATTSFSNGKTGMVDVIRIDIEIERTRTEIELLESALYPQRVSLNNLLNWPFDTVAPLNFRLPLIVDDQVQKKQGFSSHPQMQGLNQKLIAAQFQEKAAKKRGAPNLGIGLDYIFIDKSSSMTISENGRDAIMPMVSMSLPIYRKKYNSAVNEAMHMQKAIQFEIQEKENRLESEFHLVAYDLHNSSERYALNENQIKKTQQALRLVQNEYANSGRDFEELLRLQQKLLKYKMNKVSELRKHAVARAKLNYLQSK